MPRRPLAKPHERFMVIADDHGLFQHRGAVSAALAFAKDYKPTVRIHLGDALNLSCLRGNADDSDLIENIEADFVAMESLASEYKPTVYLQGNHEHRLAKAMRGYNSVVRHHCGQLIDRLEVAMRPAKCYPYGKSVGVHTYGDTKFIHGYAVGERAIKTTGQDYQSNVVMGHVHRFEARSVPCFGRNIMAYSIGCLCELEMPYNETHMGTFAQRQGWAYGTKDHHGRLTIHFAYYNGTPHGHASPDR
jgi:hypothetical protein